MALEISQASWLGLFTHLKKWASNLRRASFERKAESTAALQDVIRAVRKTAVYLRQIKRRGERNEEKEEELSLAWTNLGFKLDELNLSRLAKNARLAANTGPILNTTRRTSLRQQMSAWRRSKNPRLVCFGKSRKKLSG